MSPTLEQALGRAAIWNLEAQRGYGGGFTKRTLAALVRRGWATYADAYNESVWLTAVGFEELRTRIARTETKLASLQRKCEEAQTRENDDMVRQYQAESQIWSERARRLRGDDCPDIHKRAKMIR